MAENRERWRMWKRLAVIVLVGCVSKTPAAGETAQELLEKVRQKYESVTDAQLKFSQRVVFGVSKIEQKIGGTLYVKKKNKYRMELGEQTIVTDGKTVWSYSAPNNQVLIDNFKLDERSMTPERVLTGSSGDFYATLIGNEKLGKVDVVILKLVPKDDESIMKSMKLWVDKSTWFIKKVDVVDVNEKETEYVVDELHVNVGLQDSRFVFKISEGVQVVDLR